MLDRESPFPLYEQLVAELRDMALKHAFFDPLPSEKELARRFGVSRGTVRKAIETLVAERILTRVRGKGTYVAPRSTPRMIPLAMCELAELRQLGLFPRLKYISIVQALPPEQVRKALLIDPGRMDRNSPPTWRVARLVEANEKPVYRVISYLRTDQVSEVREANVLRGLVSVFAEAFGALPTRAFESIGITHATRTTAEMFRIAEGAPVLCVQRVAYLEDGRPVEYTLRLVHPHARIYAEVVEQHPHRIALFNSRVAQTPGPNAEGVDRAAELAVSDLPPLPWRWLPAFQKYGSGAGGGSDASGSSGGSDSSGSGGASSGNASDAGSSGVGSSGADPTTEKGLAGSGGTAGGRSPVP